MKQLHLFVPTVCIVFQKKIAMLLLPMLLAICFFTQAQPINPMQRQKQPAAPSFPSGGANKKANVTYQIIPAPANTWGYDVYVDGKMVIHQPSIPGKPGNLGFVSQTAATKVAGLVIGKMKKGEMPPNVSEDEMKQLKVLN